MFKMRIPSIKCQSKYVQIIGCILSFLLVFLSSFGGSLLGFKIGTITFSLFRILAVISFIFFILFNGEFFKRVSEKGFPITGCILLLWLAVSLLQLIWSPDKTECFRHLLIFVCVIFTYFFLYTFISNKKRINVLLFIVNLSTLIILGLCLYEIITGDYLLSFDNDSIQSFVNKKDTNIFGLFSPLLLGNTNNVGLYCLFVIVLMFIQLTINKNKWIVGLSTITLILSFFVLLCTNSRAAIFALCIFSLMQTLLYLVSNKIRKIVVYVMVPVVIIGTIGAAIYIFNYPGSISDAVRINVYKNSFYSLFKYSYGFGIGIGQAPYYLNQFANTNGVVEVHSFFLETALCSGIIMFIVFCSSFVMLEKRIYKSMLSDEDNVSFLTITIFCFFIAFFVASFGPSSFFAIEWPWIFVFILLMVVDFYITKLPSIKVKETANEK